MAAPVTNVDTLINASGCYSAQSVQPSDQKVVDIYLLAAQLNAVGGVNYLTDFNVLITDSVCYANKNPGELRQIELQIDYNNAVAAGASISSDVNTQLSGAACIRNSSKEQMDAMLLFLKASLGYAKAFPQ